MANVDTGLGWSADENWILSVSGKVGEFVIFELPTAPAQPIPVGTSYNDAVLNGFVVAKWIRKNGNEEYVYACASTPGVFAYTLNGPEYNGRAINIAFAAFQKNAIVYIATVAGTSVSGVTRSIVAGEGWTYERYNTTKPSTYYDNQNAGAGWTPYYPSLSAFSADVTATRFDITKVNAGVAVAGVATWNTGSAVFITPVLISSVSANTDMSTTNPNIYFAKLNVRMQGINFYMGFFQSKESVESTFEFADLISKGSLSLEHVCRLIASSEYANILVNETVDPYDPFGTTQEGGGDPDPNPQDDDIEEEDLPTLSFSSAGFARIYRPSLQQINDLADYMWTDQTFLQTVINHLKQLLENPMDAVISLSLIPCVPPVGADVPVKVMYVNTGVSMPPVTNQFVQVDCGNFALKEMYGSALDYNPYTKVQLYLPYVGTVKLDTDEVMGKTLQVKYNIDVVTGVCCAYVIAGGDVLYQFSGHCSINQPISSADFSSYINAAIAAAKVGIAAATGGAAAAAGAAAGGAPAPTPAVGGGSSAPELPPSTALIPAVSSGPYQITPNYPGGSGIRIPNINFAELSKPGNINTVASAMGGKVDVMHSGGFGGNSGYLAAVRRPYLIVTRPRIANPQQYGQFNGRPSMMYLNLGSCTGYTQVQSVYLTGFDATNPELAEISELLKGGVVL